jgi:hypothetical protein
MKKINLILIAVLFLSGCTSEISQKTETPANVPSVGYPISTLSTTNDVVNSYPVEITPTFEEVIIPTADSTKGNVTFIVNYKDTPLANYSFFLADVLKGADGNEMATALDRVNSPHAVSNPDGKVVFYNVEPGRYGLMIIEGMNSYLLLNPFDGNSQIIEVSDNKTTDLGVLNYSDLPLD